MRFIHILLLLVTIISCKPNTDKRNNVENSDIVPNKVQKSKSIALEENNGGSDTLNSGDNKNSLSLNKVKLPFDFQKYQDLCYLKEDPVCDEEFPSYEAEELLLVTKLINNTINKNKPETIYCIENGGLGFEIYVFNIRADEDFFYKTYLINVKNNTIIASQEIGRSVDGDVPEDVDVTGKTFIIDSDLTITIFDKVYNKKNKLSKKYKITSDGVVVMIK